MIKTEMFGEWHVVEFDQAGNPRVPTGERTFWIYWGEITILCQADTQEEAACKLVAAMAVTGAMVPQQICIRVKPQGKGGRDPEQEMLFGRDYILEKAHEKYGVITQPIDPVNP